MPGSNHTTIEYGLVLELGAWGDWRDAGDFPQARILFSYGEDYVEIRNCTVINSVKHEVK